MTHDDAGTGSPFHRGERIAQERMGVRDSVERRSRRSIRNHMPDQHRDFYGELPFLLIGTADEAGRPWASIVPGRPGFIASPDPRRLEIGMPPLSGDPLNRTLGEGAPVGVLGIQPHTRRRNRANGRFAAVRCDGFGVSVERAFGNCPQYIQTRSVGVEPEIDFPRHDRPVFRSNRLDDEARRIVARADTAFVATAHLDGGEPDAEGVDVSHRGGRPGFVAIEDDRTLVLPDFSGNNHFNTVGNILLNPKAGFLFVDFERGDLIYLTGGAEIVWDGADLRGFTGAERLIRLRIDEAIRIPERLPLRFVFGAFSPMLKGTGSWSRQ